MDVAGLLPHLTGLTLEAATVVNGTVRLDASAKAVSAACVTCGEPSTRVHSRYWRQVSDAALGGQPTVIRLRVRRFFCDHAACPSRTFAEQFPGLTLRKARCTTLLREMLTRIGLSMAGRAGARLAAALGLPASRNTLLRLVTALPDPPAANPVTVLGLDDFAFRRGRTYGTVLIDMATHRPIDLLPDREADTLAAWLADHPGVEVICRDRGGAYAAGARAGAPDAIQVADRWHLWKNLADHVEKTAHQHRSCLRDQPDPEQTVHGPEQEAAERDERVAEVHAQLFEQRLFVQHARERFAAVQALKAEGLGIKTIKKRLGLAKETVRKYYRATSIEDVLANARDGRARLLADYKPYLHEQFNAGITNGSQLFREIRDQGYRGSLGTVLAYLQPFRTAGVAPAATPAPPKARDVTRWILTHPDRLEPDDQVALKNVLARCPHLERTAGHVTAFAEMLTNLGGAALDDWITAVQTDDLPHLRSFATGLTSDYDAVRHGLTLTHNSGPVEGNVNRIKMLKRQMYGRAGFDLLRKRVLLAS